MRIVFSCILLGFLSSTDAYCVDGANRVECEENGRLYAARGTLCEGFYHCASNSATLQCCPAYTNFHPKLQVCVWYYQYACPESYIDPR